MATGPATVHRILLQRKGSHAALLSPSYLRNFLRGHMTQALAAVKADRKHAAALLSYCLQDIDDQDAASCSELKGVSPTLCLPLARTFLSSIYTVSPTSICWWQKSSCQSMTPDVALLSSKAAMQ